MENKVYLLGVDVSTTSVKALLIDEAGQLISSANTSQPISTPFPLWSEQNPADWWQGACQSIRQTLASAEISGDRVRAIGLTGQMHGLVLLDASNRVLRPAILWNDQRTAPECDELTGLVGFNQLLNITGNKALTGFTAPKILWVRNHEPDIYKQIAHILLPKDYVRYCLTGGYATDKADGSGMQLFDLGLRTWSEPLLEALEISSSWLPEVFEGPEITGVVSETAADLTGLKAGTPVVGGGGDQAAHAVGVGVIEPGLVALTLGTSGVVFAVTDMPLIEPQGRLHAFCHSVPGMWHLMGVMLSAAGSLQWYRDTLLPDLTFDDLSADAQHAPPGSDGLFFLPYLTGERTPHPDPLARAAFVGLTIRHARAHMTRAVLEGVAFGLRDSMELIHSAGLGEILQVRVSGGGAKSSVWRQILADVLGTELVTVNTTEAGAFGAALLAGVGVRVWKDVQESCRATIKTDHITKPQPGNVNLYQQSYTYYQTLYPALKPLFSSVGAQSA